MTDYTYLNKESQYCQAVRSLYCLVQGQILPLVDYVHLREAAV